MAKKFEYYNTGANYATGISGLYWDGQTFTPTLNHRIISVKLVMYRFGSPGTITVSIRATDGSNHPTGLDLCLGTTNGNTLTTDGDGEWREIVLGNGCNLLANTKYAIVVRLPGGDINNDIELVGDITDPSYSGGQGEYSDDGGISWYTWDHIDFMFEEWGIREGPLPMHFR